MKRRHDPDDSSSRPAPYRPARSPSPQNRHAITDPTEKYARRPRRKTRPDRYEYKSVAQRALTSRQSRKLDHKKPWAVLNDEFQAPNVSSQRLTLKPSHGPGILANAKASGPLQRQGLPDLTFTEMDFLRKKNKQDDSGRRGLDKQILKRKTHKAPNMNDEISNFFSRPENDKRKASSPLKTSHQQYETPKSSSMHMYNQHPGSADVEARWKPDDEVPMLKHFRAQSSHRPTSSHKNAATSYVSCSRSPVRKANAPTRPVARSAAAPRSYEEAKPSPAQEVRRIETPTSINPHSSASNHFFKAFTTNALLGGVEAFAQRGRPYFSLGDLKDLADERRIGSVPVHVNDSDQPRSGHSSRPCGLFMEGKDLTRDTIARAEATPLQHEGPRSSKSVLSRDCRRGRTSHIGELSVVDHEASQSAPRASKNHRIEDATGAIPVAKDAMPPQYSNYWPSSGGREPAALSGASHLSHHQLHAGIIRYDNSPEYLSRPSSRTGSQSLDQSSWWPSHGQHETSKTSATPLLPLETDTHVVESVRGRGQFSVPAAVPELRRPSAYADRWRPPERHEVLEFPLGPRHYEHEYDGVIESRRPCKFVNTASVEIGDDVANPEPSQTGHFEVVGEIGVENPVDGHNPSVSDGLDEFDIHLLQMTSPRVSPRPSMATVMPRFHEILEGEEIEKRLEEASEVAAPLYTPRQCRPQPSPVRSSYNLADASQHPSTVFSRHADYHWNDSTPRALPFQHVSGLSGLSGQIPEQPESQPYTGFSRRHVLY
ncbi:hypothetical protein LTR10_020979 [Elasticomyces elasticus]|uniref:Uncharacterized protein n=1 Tax=Exophiala sideris TaxID=1016849 RepID=A0ABR0J8R6_9EURO|nr:hypothetical protein LTR10_020979 [Elasticomyces elasticus]KAK5027945.1 hypothetical protein LTS07_006821 [Exophiala sideris]KAK5037464.1 hypothetical protein LTR13_004621 [Exophiala sideris]KAK5059125.1 hypothetical protein LTR69_006414 [Exophiala sideris]KAK5182959.1 hypothetical protein LTR44_004669 [Eurotiomycetes sp. CCFEE 6388]